MSIKLAMDGMGAAFAPESYFNYMASLRSDRPGCYCVGEKPVLTTTIAACRPGRYMPKHVKDYIDSVKNIWKQLFLSFFSINLNLG